MTCAHFLEDMLQDKKFNGIYLHCQYGIESSATVLLTYLCLYYQVELNKGIEYIKKSYPEAEPCIKDVSHLLYFIQKYEKIQKRKNDKIEEQHEQEGEKSAKKESKVE